MNFSMRRFRAMVTKEWKDATRNPQILLNAGMPILLAVLFGQRGFEPGDLAYLSMPVLIAISVTGAFVQANMIAEEKEKHTLRALMLSPASKLEVLAGKSATTSLFALIVCAICVLVSGIPPVHLGYVLLLSFLLLLIFMALGTIIGLIARTASESSIVGLPILLVFVFGPIFVPDFDLPALMEFVHWLPSYQFVLAFTELLQDGGLRQIAGYLFYLLAWAAGTGVLSLLIYSRKRFDK
ncbi:ABC transporter permease [Paenibacillus daejeonensis]|uniref:ABC transporter permease n=1 Tax=Paenibacillus daejeonensis TaxID=135193 RepID=UPI000366CF43|nr:ABC transporter permease [Paenibacillus daejeonensis]